MIRLALFDIDGTLVRTGGAGVKAFARVFATEFNATDGFERLKFAGRTDFGIVREFFDVHRIPATEENFRRFFERYVYWLDHILASSRTETCPGVWEFIGQLRELRPPPLLGLLTGNIRLGAEIKLRMTMKPAPRSRPWPENEAAGSSGTICATIRSSSSATLRTTSVAAGPSAPGFSRLPRAAPRSPNCSNITPIGRSQICGTSRQRKSAGEEGVGELGS